VAGCAVRAKDRAVPDAFRVASAAAIAGDPIVDAVVARPQAATPSAAPAPNAPATNWRRVTDMGSPSSIFAMRVLGDHRMRAVVWPYLREGIKVP
jgi:hypothetical protein